MSEFYLASTLMWNASLEEMFSLVYESGLDGIEMWAQHWFARDYRVQDYQRLAALYPLKTFVHGCSWDLNPASLNEEIRQASVRELRRSMDLAAAIGAYEVTVHPGHHTFRGMPQSSGTKMYQSLEELRDYAERCNIDISLEIMEKKAGEFVTSVEEMKKLTGKLTSDFYYTLDAAHCESEEEILHSLKQGLKFSKIHISNRRGNTLHTLLADGDHDFEKLLPKLDTFRIPFVVEGFDSDREFTAVRKNVSYLKKFGGEKR